MIRIGSEFPPTISDIYINQEMYPSKIVSIRYDIASLISNVIETNISISDDDGLTWDVPATHAWGDIGPNISSGTGKTIYWNAGSDYPNQLNQNMRVKIIADDGE